MPRRYRDVIHIRVSREEQARPEHFSIEMQDDEDRRYSERTGGEVVQVFTEVQRTWRDEIEKRPTFCQALDFATDPANRIDRFIVYCGDRFARKKFVFFLADYILKQGGVTLCSTREIFDDEEMGEVNKGFSAMMAEVYSSNLSRVLRDAFKKKRALGGWSGYPPFGYKREKGKLVKDPIRAPGYLLAYRVAREGAESFTQITEIVRAAGYRGKQGKPLSVCGIIGMLRNPVYCGMMRVDTLSPTPAVIPGTHEALISKEDWDKLQVAIRRIPRKSGGQPHGHKEHRVLVGILECARCGRHLIGASCGQPKYSESYYQAYGCYGRKSYHDCTLPIIRYDVVEEEIVKLLQQLALPSDWQARVIARLNLPRVQTVTLEQIEEEERRLTRLYENRYIATWEEFEERWNALQAKREELRPPLTPAVLEIGEVLSRGVAAMWQHPDADPQAKRRLARALWEKIKVDATDPRHITVTEVVWRPEAVPLLNLGTDTTPL